MNQDPLHMSDVQQNYSVLKIMDLCYLDLLEC